MKTQKRILIAFILNLSFSAFEFLGGILTGSVAILSDAVHDLGDAAGIGIAYFLEKISKKEPDKIHTYGYARYSVLGSLITTAILIFGSVAVIVGSVNKFINLDEINYDGMIIFAIVGVAVNLCAALFTRHGESLNQKAVNLHMLEDVLGWILVLVGAIVMRFTDFAFIDPIMSIIVSLFILMKALGNLKDIFNVFLEKAPQNVCADEIVEHIKEIDGVKDVHHLHLWSMDGQNHYATMHVVCDNEAEKTKAKIREELLENGVGHATIEIESSLEHCFEKQCKPKIRSHGGHCHHHH